MSLALLPIKELPELYSSRKLPLHGELDRIVYDETRDGRAKDDRPCENADAIRYECHLFLQEQLRKGHFMFNSQLFKTIWGTSGYERLLSIVRRCSTEVGKHHTGKHSKKRCFLFPGIPVTSMEGAYVGGDMGVEEDMEEAYKHGNQGIQEYVPENQWIDELQGPLVYLPDEAISRWITIPESHFEYRDLRWLSSCQKLPNFEILDDRLGLTPWADATLSSLRQMTIPALAPQHPEAIQRALARLVNQGVVLKCRKRHGRLYHSLTEMPTRITKNKPYSLRELCRAFGLPVCEPDIHGSYYCAGIYDAPDNASVVESLKNKTFYEPFRGPYEQFRASLEAHEAELRAHGDIEAAKRIAFRLATGSLKVEVNRQCLFFKDQRSSRPLWEVMRQAHPAMAKRIKKLRNRFQARDLSAYLQGIESKIMIDGAMLECFHKFGFCLPYHDGLMVTVGDASEAEQVIRKHAKQHLGFEPFVATKGLTSPQPVQPNWMIEETRETYKTAT